MFLLVAAPCAFAGPDERAIKETAKRTGYSVSEVREHYSGCGSGITPWMNLCAEYNFIASDLKLNDLYGSVKKNVKGTSAEERLIQAQRAWLKFRDLTCKYESEGYAGGTGRAGIELSCMQRQTEARIKDFEAYLQCTEPGRPGEW